MSTERWAWLRRAERIFKAGFFGVLLTLPTLYVVMFVAEAYSARQAKRVLNGLEQLRVGSSEADLVRAVRSCRGQKQGEVYVYGMIAGPYRAEWVWEKLSDMLGGRSYRIFTALNDLGLRYWTLGAVATVHDEKIARLETSVWVVGRYELLGATWELADRVPDPYDERPLSLDDQRTYLNWYHIMSVPSGEGFHIIGTPGSTDKELHARHINTNCLFSFKGCEGLCELMPNLVAVLDDRGRGFGGCVWGIPPAKCRPTHDAPCP